MEPFQYKQDQEKILKQELYDKYVEYLSTERLDYSNKVRRPVKASIFDAMVATDKQYNHHGNTIEEYFESGRRVLFWSDQHFFHENIIKYSNRPFANAGHMNNVLRDNYLSVVQDNDLVIFGGDVAFSELELSVRFLQGLPGYKILILGNHDFSHKDQFRDYRIFDEIKLCDSFRYVVDDIEFDFLISHYPIANDLLDHKTFNIHGHIHNLWGDKKNINISVERIDYTPQDISYIVPYVQNWIAGLNHKEKKGLE